MTIPRVIGVHLVDSEKPVHLIEIDLAGCGSNFDWNSVTQRDNGLDPDYWQAAYDETPVPNLPEHWCFFFHLLKLDEPLSYSSGDLQLPAPSPMPEHLRFIRYEYP